MKSLLVFRVIVLRKLPVVGRLVELRLGQIRERRDRYLADVANEVRRESVSRELELGDCSVEFTKDV